MSSHLRRILFHPARAEGCGGPPALILIKLVALICLGSLTGAAEPAPARTPPAGSDQYLQTTWATEEGLPQNSVNAILQTRDGYLWLGTFGGLARFDGVKFTTFNSGNTPGLKSNRILSLCEGRDGRLWLGAETGELMSYKDGVGQTYTTEDGLPGGYVWALHEDRGGALWAGTSKGLARFDGGRFTAYTTRDGLPDDEVWAIQEDEDGRLWVVTDRGLVEFDGGKFTTYRPPAGLAEGLWAASSVRRGGGLWLGTRSGIASFNEGSFTSYKNPASAPEWKMRTIMEDGEGTLWISYFQPSVVYRFSNGTFSLYPMTSAGGVIRSMYEDREGNLWMGSDGGGLIRLKKRRLATYTADDGLPSDSVRAITEDGTGGIWIATNSGLAHQKAGRFTTYTDKDGMLSYDLFALCRDRAGSLWVGSNYGLTQLKGDRFINYTTAQGLSHPEVHSLAEDREGNLWVGTIAGLNRLREGRFTVYRRSDGLVHDDVRFIMQARDGALWLGTTGGASRFKDGAFTSYTTRQGLSNDYVRAILEEPDGTLWLGTYGGGLNRLKDGRFTTITTKDGLFDDFISRILEDERGNFWLLGNRGISRVSRRELNDFAEGRALSVAPVSYGVADGMKSSEGNGGFQPAGWRAADGKMWFPTIKGVAVVEPHEINSLPPPVRIEQVSVDRAALPAGQPVRLEPRQENLEISYTGLSFTRPEQVKFKYRLVGLDHAWVDAGTRRTAYYSHLPPGAYTFEVMAENGDGVWSETAAALAVVVRPPFWRTWWFLTLCALSVVGVAFGVYRLRVARLERARAAQEEFSRRLINAHESERRRIAAELHDGLGQSLAMIKNSAVFAAHTAEDLETAKEQLANITAQSAQAISEVREIAHNLRPYLLDRLGLTKAIKSMLNKLADASSTDISFEVDDIDDLFPREAEMSIYRIVQEGLNNVLKHAAATAAGVAIRKGERAVTISIRDNGKGFDPNAPRDGDAGKGGFGLLGMAERVRMLGGTHRIESSTGKGTTIIINIDFNRTQGGAGSDGRTDTHRDGR